MKDIVELYCLVDDIIKQIEQNFEKKSKKGRVKKLTKSELITLALIGHFESIPTSQLLYNRIETDLKSYFKNIPCYEQFTRGIRSISKYLVCIIQLLCQVNLNKSGDLFIVDSTSLPVNRYNKLECPKWTSDEATTAKNIFGYYHGFKLHLIINRNLEVVSFMITKANFHDVKSLSQNNFIKNIKGIIIADKGYVASNQLLKKLNQQV